MSDKFVHKKPKSTKPSGASGKPYGSATSTGRPSTGRPSTGRPATGKPSDNRPATGKPSTAKPSGIRPGESEEAVEEKKVIKTAPRIKAAPINTDIRLQKYLAEAGVASRRKSEEYILAGRVTVNGKVVTELGTKVNGIDVVKIDGKHVRPETRKVYIMLNKPVGYVTTSKDQFDRKTVLDLIEGVSERIYPIGRLDYDTSGLLLLTNDGELANRLMHPKHETDKTYQVKIDGRIDEEVVFAFKKGVMLDDGVTSPARIRELEAYEKNSLVEVVVHEGKNRQVRRMLEALGHDVLKLKRVALGPLKLDKLEEGEWRYLSPDEVKTL
ncbi:MAG: pseudouridine synthase [Clostridiales bacterium]|nr:pseudouridine synthase [Clostridiales bacterium]